MAERVADYPRPPRLEASSRRIRIHFADRLIADTRAAFRVLETHHPPSWYLPPQAFLPGVLQEAEGSSFCEWKGLARYWDIVDPRRTAAGSQNRSAVGAGWSYPNPTPGFAAIRDHVAIYAGLMQQCLVDEEAVRPQPGGFYGGWITDDVIGPFKGGPGTLGW